jgi:SAM-dependent methyltransferase
VQECVRVLRPGGSLAVVDNVVPGSLEQTEAGAELRAAGDYINAFEKLRDPSHERCLSLAEWVELFQQAGLTLLHQEIQPKAMELIDWAGRMKSGAEQLPELRRRLLAAPAGVTALLQPTTVGDDVHFLLAEAIVIGRK